MLLFPALLRAQGEPAPSDVPETPQNAGAGKAPSPSGRFRSGAGVR